MIRKTLLAILCLFLTSASSFAGGYKNFEVSVFVVVNDVQKMTDRAWAEAQWAKVTDGLKVDKVYLETYREEKWATQEQIDAAKAFFKEKGVKTAGGIATCLKGWPAFITLCYTDPKDRKKLQDVVEFTAKNFDEIIMDDFLFYNTKYPSDILAKGKKSWTQFRLEQMAEVAKDVLVGPAHKVNPKVKMVIKYPNWYEHFPNCGYNLEEEPKIFDGIYTGTETRDAPKTDQHLQQYLGYDLMLYLENIKPGGNGGGWVDPYDWRDKERYGEQLWLTLFAKAREITLFNFRSLMEPMRATPQSPVTQSLTSYAGSVFEKVDRFMGQLGKPVGVMSYKPIHSSGEDFINDFLGMCGIPVEMTPTFPDDAPTVLLTESAKFDPVITEKIMAHLLKGKNVVITSGLLKALQSRGFDEVAEIECLDRKAMVRNYNVNQGINRGVTCEGPTDILIPQVRYPTNDVWETITARVKGVGYPILLRAPYYKNNLYVLTVPDCFADLYNYPPDVLNKIREIIAGDMPVRLEGPSQIGLFLYDNGKFIVENFAAPGAKAVACKVVLDKKVSQITNLVTGKKLSGIARGDNMIFDLSLGPASYQVLSPE